MTQPAADAEALWLRGQADSPAGVGVCAGVRRLGGGELRGLFEDQCRLGERRKTYAPMQLIDIIDTIEGQVSEVASMSTTVAIVNEKGGVGKTVSTYSLGSALARRSQRVLLVDLDPQDASLSIAAGVHEPAASVADALQHYITQREAAPLEGYVTPLGPNLDLLPNSKGLASAEHVLANVRRREYVLAEVLAPATAHYDTILIDCPPSLGVLVVNALTAADVVLIPVVPEYMAAIGIKGLLNTVREMRREKLNPRLTVSGIIFTMVDTRTRHSREVAEDVRAAFGADIPILGEIRRSTRVNEAMQAGRSILDYAEQDAAAQAYQAIADELLTRWGTPATASTGTEVARG